MKGHLMSSQKLWPCPKCICEVPKISQEKECLCVRMFIKPASVDYYLTVYLALSHQNVNSEDVTWWHLGQGLFFHQHKPFTWFPTAA